MTEDERNAVIQAIDLYCEMWRCDLDAVDTIRVLRSARVQLAADTMTLSERIDTLERQLQALHRQRAGTIEPGEDWGWCTQCGRTPVRPVDGEDTCQPCITELRDARL